MTASLSLLLYRGATTALEPFVPGILRRRARRGKEDAERLDERLGHSRIPRPDGFLVWLHGASVGETLSLLPFIARLRERRPEIAILVTSGTRTSAEMLARRLPDGVIHQYAPVDAPGAVERFLRHWRPSLAIFAESEVWPNLILRAKAAGARLALISARITLESARGWTFAPGAARALFSAFEVILPQDEASADRLAALGGRVGTSLNLKFIGEALPADELELSGLRGEIGGRPVVLAASTHPGEDDLVCTALMAISPAPLVILAPRHPERGDALAANLRAAGKSVAQRSRDEPVTSETEVYVADTLGELGLFFRLAHVVVMAGSFIAGIGGHNPLEPARLGAAIVSGPHVYNFAEVYGPMTAQGAALTAADGEALTATVAALLAEPSAARKQGEKALSYVTWQGQAAERALATLEAMLP